jgi:hypothetical protein
MAVAYVSNISGKTTPSASSITLANVVGSGGNIVVAMVSWRDNSAAIATSGATYGGNAMTQLGTDYDGAGANSGHAVFYYIDPSGTADVVISFTGANPPYIQATAAVFSGVNTSAPFGTVVENNATDSSAPYETTTSAASSESGGLVVDLLTIRSDITGLTIGADQTQISAQDQSATMFHRTSYEAGAASVTMSWSWGLTGQHYRHTVIPIAPAAAGDPEGSLIQGKLLRGGLLLGGVLTR